MTDLAQALRLAGSATPWKKACRVAATSAVVLEGEQTVDGVVLVAGDRVLLTAQDDAVEHGIWVCSTGRWSRAEDWGVDAFALLGTTVMVLEGDEAGLWTLTDPTSGAITIGVTETQWEHTPQLDHGDLAGGTLHAYATTESGGFMSPAQVTALATAAAVATSAAALKAPVRVVIDTNAALGGVPNVSQADQVALANGDRVALVAQTDAAQNGIYVVSGGALARASDFDSASDVQLNTFFRVLEGAVYNGSWWHLTSPVSGAVVLGTTSLLFDEFKPARFEIEPNTLVLRNDEGNIKASEIETSRALGPDAETLPSAFYLRGGRPSIANLGKEPYSNVVLQCGIGAQSTNGESSMLNFTHGDSRDPELGPEYIAAEMGFVDQFGYDPATTESEGASPPGTRTWREKTPRYFRIHATQNTNNGMPIGILLVGGVDLNMSASDLVQIGATARSGLLRRAWNNFTATSDTAGDGQGGTIVEVNRYISTTSNETKKIYVGADVPTSKLAMARCVLIGHAPGGNRDVFEFRFNWLGGAVGSGSAVVEALTAYPGSTALAGRVAVADEDFASGNLGKVRVSVTGVVGVPVNWTLHMELFIPPIV